MYDNAKTSLVVAAVIAMLFTIGLALAAPAVRAQEPSTVETGPQASLESTDLTGSAPAENPTTELFVIEAAREVSANSAEVTLPATSVEPGSELTQWEKSHLQSPIAAEYTPPTGTVKSGSELPGWEKHNLTSPNSADSVTPGAVGMAEPGIPVFGRLGDQEKLRRKSPGC
jgi:hypothetical protein